MRGAGFGIPHSIRRISYSSSGLSYSSCRLFRLRIPGCEVWGSGVRDKPAEYVDVDPEVQPVRGDAPARVPRAQEEVNHFTPGRC